MEKKIKNNTVVQHEILKTILELNDSRFELLKKENNSVLRKKIKLAEKEKMYRKLSDIEIMLSKIECHTNATRQYAKLQTNLLYHLVRSNCNYDEEGQKKWWREFCSITD